MSKHFKYRSVALGGTFDHLHKGHRGLLTRAFEEGESVTIGLTSDNFVKNVGKKVLRNFEERKAQLVNYLAATYPSRKYVIAKLEDRFGPIVTEPRIEAIIVSAETFPIAESANEIRKRLGYPEMTIEQIQTTLADDGEKISSTRIRAGEIDTDGHVFKKK